MGRCEASVLLPRTALLRVAMRLSHHGVSEPAMTHLM
jgi:hypothetical protein